MIAKPMLSDPAALVRTEAAALEALAARLDSSMGGPWPSRSRAPSN